MAGRQPLKTREIPPALTYGGIALVVLIVAAVAYSMFLRPAPLTDPTKLTTQQLSDPDPPRSTNRTAPATPNGP